MNYTDKELKEYSDLLSFADSSELYLAFSKQDKTLSDRVTVFHIETSILEATEEVDQFSVKESITILELRDYMKQSVFGDSADEIELERKLDFYVPKMIEKDLLDKNLLPTKKGIKMLDVKTASAYNAGIHSETVN